MRSRVMRLEYNDPGQRRRDPETDCMDPSPTEQRAADRGRATEGVLPDRASGRSVSNLRPALRFVRPYLAQVAIAGAALVVTASVTLSVGQGVRLLIDEGFATGSPDVLLSSIGVFVALVLLLAAGTFVRFYYVSWVGERVSADIRLAVYARLVRMHPAFFEENQPTEIQSRITTDTTLLQTVIGSSVSIALRNAFMFVGGLLLLFVTNPRLATIVIVSAPIVISPIVLFGRRVRRLSRSSQDTLADVGSHAGESLRHIKIVQAFSPRAPGPGGLRGPGGRRLRRRGPPHPSAGMAGRDGDGADPGRHCRDAVGGRPGRTRRPDQRRRTRRFHLLCVHRRRGRRRGQRGVGGAAARRGRHRAADGAAARDFRSCPSPTDRGNPGTPGAVAFQGVSFRYPTRPDVAVLTDIELSLRPGETVALVGPSGAGKSTLLDLVQRFYDPTEGTVSVAGVDARDLALDTLRREIAFVPQHPVLFAGTVRDNVRYGDADADDARVTAALRAAHAMEFVDALAEGPDTIVGEDGQGLSGGQRQRLAIARALLPDPRILLMDEATSALDARSEQAIRQTIADLKGRCTILIVAHRLSTVAHADRIVVLADGRIGRKGPTRPCSARTGCTGTSRRSSSSTTPGKWPRADSDPGRGTPETEGPHPSPANLRIFLAHRGKLRLSVVPHVISPDAPRSHTIYSRPATRWLRGSCGALAPGRHPQLAYVACAGPRRPSAGRRRRQRP